MDDNTIYLYTSTHYNTIRHGTSLADTAFIVSRTLAIVYTLTICHCCLSTVLHLHASLGLRGVGEEAGVGYA